MKTAKQLLEAKHQEVIWSLPPDASVYEACKLMTDKSIGALLIVEGKKLVGIVSERDVVKRVILPDKSAKDTPVREIMTRQIMYVRPEQSIAECMTLMTEKGIRHLPVIDERELSGVISIKDVVKDLISEKEFIIDQLTEYITTGY